MLETGEYVFFKDRKLEFWLEQANQTLFGPHPFDIFFRNQLQEIELRRLFRLFIHIVRKRCRPLSLALLFFGAFSIFSGFDHPFVRKIDQEESEKEENEQT